MPPKHQRSNVAARSSVMCPIQHFSGEARPPFSAAGMPRCPRCRSRCFVMDRLFSFAREGSDRSAKKAGYSIAAAVNRVIATSSHFRGGPTHSTTARRSPVTASADARRAGGMLEEAMEEPGAKFATLKVRAIGAGIEFVAAAAASSAGSAGVLAVLTRAYRFVGQETQAA